MLSWSCLWPLHGGNWKKPQLLLTSVYSWPKTEVSDKSISVKIEGNHDIIWIFLPEEKIILTKIKFFFWIYFYFVETGAQSCLGIYFEDLQFTGKFYQMNSHCKGSTNEQTKATKHRQPSLSWSNVTYCKTHTLSCTGGKDQFKWSQLHCSLLTALVRCVL